MIGENLSNYFRNNNSVITYRNCISNLIYSFFSQEYTYSSKSILMCSQEWLMLWCFSFVSITLSIHFSDRNMPIPPKAFSCALSNDLCYGAFLLIIVTGFPVNRRSTVVQSKISAIFPDQVSVLSKSQIFESNHWWCSSGWWSD